MLLFNELDQSLKKIRKEKNRSAYIREVKSRAAISAFYNKHIIYENALDKVIACESLYNRIVKLKRRVEAFKLIVIPIFITIIFGVLITYGFEQIGEARNVREEFLINAQTLWDKKTADLTFEEAKKHCFIQ